MVLSLVCTASFRTFQPGLTLPFLSCFSDSLSAFEEQMAGRGGNIPMNQLYCTQHPGKVMKKQTFLTLTGNRRSGSLRHPAFSFS